MWLRSLLTSLKSRPSVTTFRRSHRPRTPRNFVSPTNKGRINEASDAAHQNVAKEIGVPFMSYRRWRECGAG